MEDVALDTTSISSSSHPDDDEERASNNIISNLNNFSIGDDENLSEKKEDRSCEETSNNATSNNNATGTGLTDLVVDWSNSVAPAIEEHVFQPTARAFHNFFYTTDDPSYSYDPHVIVLPTSRDEGSTTNNTDDEDEEAMLLQQIVERFWKQYDQIVMISLGSILGILCRVFASQFFTWTHEYSVFRPHSVLFTSLPLNCLSCFLLGIFCSGEEAMGIILSKQQQVNDEQRQVALDAYERRIRASTSIALFPAPKQVSDVVIHYNNGDIPNNTTTREQKQPEEDLNDTNNKDTFSFSPPTLRQRSRTATAYTNNMTTNSLTTSTSPNKPLTQQIYSPRKTKRQHLQLSQEDEKEDSQLEEEDHQRHEQQEEHKEAKHTSHNNEEETTKFVDQISKNVHLLIKLKIAQGWDVGVSARAMQHDILLGLRVGLCGAISTFSSWNSTMVTFLRMGKIPEAFWGYLIGLELPILAYRTGQHAAVYIFIAKCRRETIRETKHNARTYGLRILDNDDDDDDNTNTLQQKQGDSPLTRNKTNKEEEELRILNEVATERTQPSVRALLTAISMLVLVCILTSFKIFIEPSQRNFALSLLFTPVGGLTRWKISTAWNHILPSFPLGTFCCNMLGCLLSSSYFEGDGSGVVASIVDGFSGALSTLAAFVVEVLQRIDPLIFQWDGITYAYVTIIWAIFIGLITVQSNEWADTVIPKQPSNSTAL